MSDLTSEQQEALEFVFQHLLIDDGGCQYIAGRRLRAELKKMRLTPGVVDELTQAGVLKRLAKPPAESYEMTTKGFLKSSSRCIFLRPGDVVLRYLKERYHQDPDFCTFTWDELKSSCRILGKPLTDDQFHQINHAVVAGAMQGGASGAFDSEQRVVQYAWGVSRDIESIVEASTFADLLASRRVGTSSGTEELARDHAPSASAMRIAVILTALPLECGAVLSLLKDPTRITHPRHGTVYEVGRLEGTAWRVAVALVGMGNEGAAVEAERAEEHFQPEVLLLVGVAGGLKDVALGDVVVSTKVYGFEFGKDAKSFKSRPEVGVPAYNWIQLAHAVVRDSQWQASAGVPPAQRAFVGPTAAGSKVVADTTSPTARLLKDNFSDALAVDMEGLGFLKAAQMSHRNRSLVVRGISDLVDGKAASDAAGNQPRAAKNAAAFTLELLRVAARLPTGKPTSEISADEMGTFGEM